MTISSRWPSRCRVTARRRVRSPRGEPRPVASDEPNAPQPRGDRYEVASWRRNADRSASRVIDSTVASLLEWWPAVVGVSAGALVLGAYLVPVLMHFGYTGWGQALFDFYSAVCAQTPEHSYFLWGYQAGIDQRLTALYGAAAVSALLFQAGHSRGRQISALRWRFYLLLTLPILLDGLTQMFGLRQSTWELRTLTGALFGAASVWALFPRLDATLRNSDLIA
jgi:uncharacterized membrane protein